MTSATRTPVPLLDLEAQYRPIRDEILAAITRVCDTQRFIMGPEVEGLERELKATLEIPEAVSVSSGTDALLAVLMALGTGPGDNSLDTTGSRRQNYCVHVVNVPGFFIYFNNLEAM